MAAVSGNSGRLKVSGFLGGNVFYERGTPVLEKRWEKGVVHSLEPQRLYQKGFREGSRVNSGACSFWFLSLSLSLSLSFSLSLSILFLQTRKSARRAAGTARRGHQGGAPVASCKGRHPGGTRPLLLLLKFSSTVIQMLRPPWGQEEEGE